MKQPLRVFIDFEFTGLHQLTTPISVGCVCDGDADTFYAEFTDYNADQVDNWVRDNVISMLWLKHDGYNPGGIAGAYQYRGSRLEAAIKLNTWLYGLYAQHPDLPLQMWGDVCAYDWVLFRELMILAHGKLPYWIYYIPFDISTLMLAKGVDPDIDRVEYTGIADYGRHDALHDASLAHLCYSKLMEDSGGRDAAA